MRRYRNLAAVLLACSGLASCGGGSPADGSFEALYDDADALAVKLNTLFPTEVMPTSGEVQYNGVIFLADDIFTSTQQVIGATNLTANFASETISGTSDNFYAYSVDSFGNPVGGGTSVDGELSHSGNDFSFGEVFITTTGSVVIEGTLRTIDGEIYAVFAGPNADMIAGLGFDMPAGPIDVDAVLIVD